MPPTVCRRISFSSFFSSSLILSITSHIIFWPPPQDPPFLSESMLDKTGESAIMKIEKGAADKRLARKQIYKVNLWKSSLAGVAVSAFHNDCYRKDSSGLFRLMAAPLPFAGRFQFYLIYCFLSIDCFFCPPVL